MKKSEKIIFILSIVFFVIALSTIAFLSFSKLKTVEEKISWLELTYKSQSFNNISQNNEISSQDNTVYNTTNTNQPSTTNTNNTTDTTAKQSTSTKSTTNNSTNGNTNNQTKSNNKPNASGVYSTTQLTVSGEYQNESSGNSYYHNAKIVVSNQSDSSIDFKLNAAHGVTADQVSTAQVSGTAKKASTNKYVFEDVKDGKTYKLTFTFDSHDIYTWVTIEENFAGNSNPYGGANVHFNGEYEKIQNY